MADWNPNAPAVAGFEWMVGRSGADFLFSDGVGFASRLHSGSAETITAMDLLTTALFLPGRYLIEVYPDGSVLPGATTVEVARPTGDDLKTNVYNQAASTSNLWQSVDEATLVTTDYITKAAAGTASIYSATYSSVSAWSSARRVLDVRLRYAVGATTATAQQVTAYVINSTGGNQIRVRTDKYQQGQGAVTFTASLGSEDPFTGLPWKASRIQELSATSGLGLALVFEDFGGGTPDFKLYQMWIEIEYCDETRVACAGGAVGSVGKTTFSNVEVPSAGTSNWAKGSGVDYVYLVRRTRTLQSVLDGSAYTLPASGLLFVPWLDSGDVPPAQNVDSACGYVVQLGQFYRPADLGDELTKLYPVMMLEAGPTQSETDNPFTSASYASVYGSHSATQKVTPTTTKTFTRARFVARPAATDSVDLTLTIDGTPVATITADDVLALDNVGTVTDPWYVVDVVLRTSMTLTGAATVDAVWSVAGGTSQSRGWLIRAAVDGYESGTSTYGGTTDYAIDGATNHTTWDLPLALFTDVVPLSTFTVTPETVPLSVTPAGPYCSIAEMDVTRMTWQASGDALQTATEIQRYDALTGSWQTIAVRTYVSSPIAPDEFIDYEAARNVESCYRARALRADGSASDWTPWTTEITDTLHYGEGGYLTTTDTGNPWHAFGGSWTRDALNAGAATAILGADPSLAIVWQGDSVDPSWVECTIGVWSAGWGLVYAFTDADNYSYVTSTATAGGTWQVREVVAGVDSLITSATGTVAAGTVVRVEYDPGTNLLDVLLNGVAVISGASTSAGTSASGLFAAVGTGGTARWLTFSCSGLSACVTPAMDECGLLFTSNEDPAQNLGYTYPTPTEFGFLDADRRVLYPIFGRNTQVAFRPTEWLGDSFSVDVTVNVIDAPDPGGRWPFDPLVALGRDGTLPYVCVLDWRERRWFASLAVSKGVNTEPGAKYVATVNVTEISDAAVPVETDV